MSIISKLFGCFLPKAFVKSNQVVHPAPVEKVTQQIAQERIPAALRPTPKISRRAFTETVSTPEIRNTHVTHIAVAPYSQVGDLLQGAHPALHPDTSNEIEPMIFSSTPPSPTPPEISSSEDEEEDVKSIVSEPETEFDKAHREMEHQRDLEELTAIFKRVLENSDTAQDTPPLSFDISRTPSPNRDLQEDDAISNYSTDSEVEALHNALKDVLNQK